MMLKLKEIRQSKSLTFKELSKQSKVAIGYLADLENGKCNNPSLATLNKIAKALNVSVTELLDDKSN